ncbi:DUF4199 domain-containing protein [Porphyromonas macacae]|uniref:DUF4199 domain-containing protein n=1 Tax=Porphyromonas macacae TaxID=28115 RepID=A0A379DKC6_9PORP|nr:DUF4199 domain-containing protein [Porphyromonas macacae]SUB78612.1 Uncharacterised protein [Porphyromonas macacae]
MMLPQLEDKSKLLAHSARIGLYLGIFFLVKYLCVCYFFRFPLLSLLYLPLTIAVPFIVFFLTKNYRNRIVSPKSGFSAFHGWQYGLMLYFFASIISSLLHYYYYAYMMPVQMVDFMGRMEEIMQRPEMKEIFGKYMNGKSWTEILNEYMAIPPLNLVIKDISNNILWGAILSIPNGLILRRKPASDVQN